MSECEVRLAEGYLLLMACKSVHAIRNVKCSTQKRKCAQRTAGEVQVLQTLRFQHTNMLQVRRNATSAALFPHARAPHADLVNVVSHRRHSAARAGEERSTLHHRLVPQGAAHRHHLRTMMQELCEKMC